MWTPLYRDTKFHLRAAVSLALTTGRSKLKESSRIGFEIWVGGGRLFVYDLTNLPITYLQHIKKYY